MIKKLPQKLSQENDISNIDIDTAYEIACSNILKKLKICLSNEKLIDDFSSINTTHPIEFLELIKSRLYKAIASSKDIKINECKNYFEDGWEILKKEIQNLLYLF